jgi:hypothetical protein
METNLSGKCRRDREIVVLLPGVEIDDLLHEVTMIGYNALVAEQAAFRLGREFAKVTDGTFINIRRVQIGHAYGRLTTNQPNRFLQRLVRTSFYKGTKDGSPTQ